MSLRLVYIILPDETTGLLDEIKKNFSTIESFQSRDERRTEIQVLLRSENAESVVDFIENKYGFLEGFRVIILPVEATIPRLETDEQSPEKQSSIDVSDHLIENETKRLYREELYDDINNVSSGGRTFVLLVILSSLVAAIGLLRANDAIIIGAMVIAPLLGPNMGLVLSATLGDPDLAKKSLKTNLTGIFIALSIGITLGWFFEIDISNQEMASRLQVNYADFILAFASGAAGALSFTSGAPGSLIGVMVAVALLPPLMVFGLLLGNGQFQVGLNALLLFLTNMVCVNISGVLMFLYQGVRPNSWWKAEKAKKQTRVAIIIWMALLGVLHVLIWLDF